MLARIAMAAAAIGFAAAARAGDPQVDRAIAALAEEASVKVRAQAAFVLAQRGSREAVPALCKALSHDRAPAVRVAVATALGRIGGHGALVALQAAAQGDADGAVREVAARAMEEAARGARSVVLEEVQGGQGDARARGALRAALATHLARQGFAVMESDEPVGWRLKPSVLALDVQQSGTHLRVEVKASVIAVDGAGRIAAMVEGGARARALGPGGAQWQLASQALEAAARSIAEDLARRLLEMN